MDTNINIIEIWKTVAISAVGVIVSLISYAYLRDLKNIKADIDNMKEELEKIKENYQTNAKDFDEKNIEAHEKIHEKVNRIDKEQTETKTIVGRCKNCRGES